MRIAYEQPGNGWWKPPGHHMNEIFVFGSNLLGIHGAGAAKTARLHYGAQNGIGFGRTGDAYAIPTKYRPTLGCSESLPLSEIAEYVKIFVDYAASRPNLAFRVTRIGCGLAGYMDKDIAPMFKDAPPNCILPDDWRAVLAEGL